MEKIKIDFINMGMMLTRNARHYPDKLAVIVGEERLTYSQFNKRVNKTAHALLRTGVKKGDRVAMLLSNSIEMLELFWATAKIGAVIVPLNPMVKGADNAYIINDCEPRILIIGEKYWEEIREIRDRLTSVRAYMYVGSNVIDDAIDYREFRDKSEQTEPEIEVNKNDVCNIMYSSGTTGLPKGILHTHNTRIMYAFLWGMEYGVTFDSTILTSGSLVFNGSLAFMYPTICAGATYILMEKFDTGEVIDQIKSEKVTHTMFVPTQVITLLDSPQFDEEKLNSLQVILTLGSPLPVTRKEELCKRLPGRLFELYGLTEGFLTTIRPNDVMNKPNSVGPPMIFNEFKIVDENLKEVKVGEIGEIVGRGPTIMSQYFNNAESTRNSVMDKNWIKTGDLGYCDDRGFIYLVDRKKDMIISGGVNIFPRDIEEIISRHPNVSECAVFGIPHEKWGETPVAEVVLKQGSSILEQDLLKWVNDRVSAKYQKLSRLTVVEDFPRNSSGKILKRKMKEAYV